MVIHNNRLLAVVGKWAASCIAVVVLSACSDEGTQVSGIDGSGAPIDPVAGGGSSMSSSSVAYPPVKTLVVAQGAINGFGSVIVYGDRYDTSRASFWRNGRSVKESSFEVGDLVTVIGYQEEGIFFADEVHYQSMMSGVIEHYDYEAGIITMLGQRIRVDAGTIFEVGVDERHLRSRHVSVSGWLSDAELTATRITAQETTLSEVSGYVSDINQEAMQLTVGSMRVDFSELKGEFLELALSLDQGRTVNIMGDVNSDDEGRSSFVAQSIQVLDVSIFSQAEVVALSGSIRNIEQGIRFWVNDIEIRVDTNTQISGGTWEDVSAGAFISVRAVRPQNASDSYVVATDITVDSLAEMTSLAGVIESVETVNGLLQAYVGSYAIEMTHETAVVDLSEHHSRIGASSLEGGDYIVVEAVILNENTVRALTVKRTSPGENDRLYRKDDRPAYDWGFTPGQVIPSDPYENLLGAARFKTVSVAGKLIFTQDDVALSLRDRTVISDGEKSYSIDEILELLKSEEDSGKTIWLNYQADSRTNRVWLDKLIVRFDYVGEDVEIPLFSD